MAGDRPPELSVIVQYYRHPHVLPALCKRLQHPAIEVIVHADSDTLADQKALKMVSKLPNVRVLRSHNVHEIRGYLRGMRIARAELLCFTQDDRLPPISTRWVDTVLAIFDAMPPHFALLGLHRGSRRSWRSSRSQPQMVGACGDAADDIIGGEWHAMPTTRAEEPISFVAFANVGPLVVRRAALGRVGGGFNKSFSPR
eukprot:7091735-Prymnesium_polylepis.1